MFFRFIFLFLITFSAFADTTVKITHSYIDLSKVKSVTRFRSGIGHNYSFDSAEPCRSMKHYFLPIGTGFSDMPIIMSPLDGQIVTIETEWAGKRIEILAGLPGDQIRVTIFHVVPNADVNVGMNVVSGQILGRHVGPKTYSDIAVRDEQTRMLLSYFDLMTEAVFLEFSTYAKFPVTPQSMIITQAERDNDPLQCGPPPEEMFLSPGRLVNWVNLKS